MTMKLHQKSKETVDVYSVESRGLIGRTFKLTFKNGRFQHCDPLPPAATRDDWELAGAIASKIAELEAEYTACGVDS